MGDKVGRLHIQQPDLKTLEIRKYRRTVEKGNKEVNREKRKKEENETTAGTDGEFDEGAKPKKKLKSK